MVSVVRDVSLVCLLLSGTLLLGAVPASAGESQTQEYTGPGTYRFPGAAGGVVAVHDTVWGQYWCYAAENDGGDLVVHIGVVLLCIKENLDAQGPATTGTITVYY